MSVIGGQIRAHGVTLVNCTPSAFYPLVDAAAAGGYASLSSLRVAVLGGEPISIPRLRRWLSHAACHAEIANTYGPTECTDICACHRMDRHNMDQYPMVPLGREIPGTAVSIRDENLNPVADGEQGELCISGIGVGGGYMNDPARTAEKFVPHPEQSGEILYRTGDLARRMADGVLEFRGRMDHQVKVRGFRIELGEIELALEAHAGIKEAVVTAKTSGDEDASLTAWLIAKDGVAPIGRGAAGASRRAVARLHVPGRFPVLRRIPAHPEWQGGSSGAWTSGRGDGRRTSRGTRA